jgi:hypothetical protein
MKQGKNVRAEGFVYSCKALLQNMKKQLEGCRNEITLTCDATFNLLSNGWCLYSIGCKTLYRSRENVHQRYRPFCYLLSRTERGDGYVAMLQSLKTAQQWLEIDDIYNVKATSSDHHDGLINAIRSELPDGSIH